MVDEADYSTVAGIPYTEYSPMVHPAKNKQCVSSHERGTNVFAARSGFSGRI